MIFKKIEKSINEKFGVEINKYIKKKVYFVKTNFSCSLSSCIKKYKKSAHLDRREHKFHILYYPQIQKNNGGNLCLWKSNKKKIYDVFPSKDKINLTKKILPLPNSCVITLNTPFSYHSVTKYLGNIKKENMFMLYMIFQV